MKSNRFKLLALALAAVGAASCSSTSPAPPVPVEAAKKSDLKALVGRWVGEYSSVASGRSGSIVFELESGETTARGDVLMWPKGSKEPSAPSPDKNLTDEQIRKMPRVLNISFVETQGGYLTGTMDPYDDPDCQCQVRTVFVGSIDGDDIVGEYTTERFDKPGNPVKGTFKARRQKKG
ncbi:MAG: hypothetical protein ACM3SU_09285 [Acidobacteriota bacterium]